MSSITINNGLNATDDQRIKCSRPLLPPQILMEEFPLTLKALDTVEQGRRGAENIVKGEDDRLLVIVGPCSVHDVVAAIDYAKRLKKYAAEAKDDLHILMRVYFEKPRTTTGWKGLINDPQLDGSYQINTGLRLARGLLLEIASLGVPAGCEFLDVISPQYTGDLVSWGAIGARTTESQIHRELASGLSVPVGFKNGTDGSVTIASDAMRAAAAPHVFMSVTKQGLSAIIETHGNPYTHVILRGANSGPNYDAESVSKVVQTLEKAKLAPRLMIDCSHGNSEKNHKNQPLVAENIRQQLATPPGENCTATNIMGVMLESHINEGKQNIPDDGPKNLKYGQSVTDACMSWETTVEVLETLRKGVRERRVNFPLSDKGINPKAALAKATSANGLESRSGSGEDVREFNSLAALRHERA